MEVVVGASGVVVVGAAALVEEMAVAAAGSGLSVLPPRVRPATMVRLRMSAPAMAHQRLYQAF
jgi:hypothetical protein